LHSLIYALTVCYFVTFYNYLIIFYECNLSSYDSYDSQALYHAFVKEEKLVVKNVLNIEGNDT